MSLPVWFLSLYISCIQRSEDGTTIDGWQINKRRLERDQRIEWFCDSSLWVWVRPSRGSFSTIGFRMVFFCCAERSLKLWCVWNKIYLQNETLNLHVLRSVSFVWATSVCIVLTTNCSCAVYVCSSRVWVIYVRSVRWHCWVDGYDLPSWSLLLHTNRPTKQATYRWLIKDASSIA